MQCSLADLYQMFNGENAKQTLYNLQFLWRDLTSNFDIVGPYFTSSKTMEGKFILACVMETVQLHGLKISLLVCDGVSSNLTATHGHYGLRKVHF